MKKFLTKTFSSKPITVCGILFTLIAPTRLANADPLKEARVSQVIQDVRLLEAHAAPHPAAVDDKVTLGSAVRTGVESRAELTFNDLTITRLGANTIFSFTAGARQAELTQGTILLQVRPGAPAVRANTTAVTVSVMGGTALLATGPPTKFMVLEGIGTIYPLGHPEKAVTVHGGEMVTAEGGRISKPEKFDVNLVLATSALIADFPPLANLPLIQMVVDQQLAGESVLIATSNQLLTKSMIETIDVTDQSANTNPAVIEVRTETPTPSPTISPTITPAPTPTKFGTPSTITAPNPYLITNGTTITTDPSITTNGVTDFGKIYRGSADDGPFTLWAFGSTSAFDTALNLDTEFFADPSHLPIAAFKFQSLLLNGNPTIDLSNGGVTKLALIGVDGITSGPPGGTLTFTGLDLLVLATVNGSINLTSDVSFQNLNELAMYARGAGSNLILNSPISNIGILKLAAEGSIQLTNPGTMSVGDFETTAGNNLTLQIGGSLLTDGRVRLKTLVLPGTTVANGANVTLNIAGDYTNSSATEFSLLHVRNEGAHIGTGGNISVNIGGDLTAMSDFDLLVENTNGQIDNGGNITLNVNGSVSTQGQLSLVVENYDFSTNPAGHIGTGGNISVTTGGDLSADSISAVINNRNGGTIGSSVNLTLNITGALTTVQNGTDYFGFPSSLSLYISNRYDDTLGSTISGDATLGLSANSASIGGNLNAIISDRAGTIHGDALLTLSVAHDFTIQGDADIEILNDGGTGAVTPVAGTIDGNATLEFSANNLTANSLVVQLYNRNRGLTGRGGMIGGDANIIFNISGNLNSSQGLFVQIENSNVGPGSGGLIGSGANITFDVSGTLTEQTDATFQIQNANLSANTGGRGGTIGSDAVLTLSAGNISVGGLLDTSIRNARNGGAAGGTIGGSAILNVDVTGSITALDDLQFVNNGGGSIGSNAAIAVTAASLATTATMPGALSALIDNGGGNIGGSASINFDLSGNLTSASDANFSIDNSNGGHIDGNANILVTTGENLTANSFSAFINNRNSGAIDLGTHLTFDIGSDFTTQSDATLVISNRDEGGGGGTTGGNASINLSAANMSVGGDLVTDISASRAGHIMGSASNIVSATGDIVANGSLIFQIESAGYALNGSFVPGGFVPGGTIDGDATLNVSANSFSTANGDFEANIFSSGGGHIGGNAMVNVLASSMDVATNAYFNILNGQNGVDTPAGTIGGNAAINVSATNISGSTLNGTIDNTGGSIGGSCNLNFNLTSGLTTTGGAFFEIENPNGGTIGSNATINVNAANISIGDFLNVIIFNGNGGSIASDALITVNAANLSAGGSFNYFTMDNTGGSIGGNASINFNLGGDLTSPGQPFFGIFNSNAGTIASDATVNVSAANVIADSLVAQIDNTDGSIGASTEGGATINMNVSGTATVTNDATVAIYGSDGAVGGAAININGGNYNVGGTFLTYIDGNGTITFNNASAHADVLKAGVFGSNGTLNIGGGILSADTTLKLYAPGSNGSLNFLSNVTLGGNSLKILAANSVTIFNNVVVTIGGPNPADVYTNNANYTGFGGNGTTTGTFAGAGANNPQPLASAPPFGPPTASHPNRGTRTSPPGPPVIHVSNTDELLALLDGARVGPNGRVTIQGSKTNFRDLNRMNPNALLRAERRMMMQQTRDSTRESTRVGVRRL